MQVEKQKLKEPPGAILTPDQLRHLRCLKAKGYIDTAPAKECPKLFEFFSRLGLIVRDRRQGADLFWNFTPAGESALNSRSS